MRIHCGILLAGVGTLLAACLQAPVEPEITLSAAVVPAERVGDLRVVVSTVTTLTASWTQVDDGTGDPAFYRIKYARPPIDWKTATIGCAHDPRNRDR
jgi:hypothetical protein